MSEEENDNIKRPVGSSVPSSPNPANDLNSPIEQDRMRALAAHDALQKQQQAQQSSSAPNATNWSGS